MLYRTTKSLILRTSEPRDAEALAAARSTDFVMRYNLYRVCGADRIRSELEMYEHITLIEKETGKLVGCISVRDDELRYRMDAKLLQMWLSEEHARKGYMTQALDELLGVLLLERGHERVSLHIFTRNTPSVRLAQKLGFKMEGCFERAVRRHDGEVFDVAVYAMDEALYRKRKGMSV